MKKLIKMELKKAILSKFFVLGLLLLLVFALFSTWYMLENRIAYNPSLILNDSSSFENGKFKTNPDLPLFGFYNSWLGAEVLSLGQTLFYNLLPVAVAIPYAWSYHKERKNGYLKNIASRTDKKKYFIAKIIAVFTSGVLVVFIPIIINIALVSAFVPSISPFPGYTLYNYLYIGDMWIEYYYNNPAFYVALYVTLDCLYGGLFALLSFAISFYIKSMLAVLFTPYILCMVTGYINGIIVSNLNSSTLIEFRPTVFLHSLQPSLNRLWWVILLITLVIMLFSLITITVRGFKDEIF